MRVLFVLGLLAAVGCSKPPPPDEEPRPAKPTATLSIGSPAPSITASHWLNGGPVRIEVGKVTVVDFWAVWCGPCRETMPHLADLLAEYARPDLQAVAVTTQDDRGNTLDKITPYVQGQSRRLPFPFAVCSDSSTYEAFMEASGQAIIPCSFVFDRSAKLAYIGHPLDLEFVLPRVLADQWTGAASASEVATETAEMDRLFEAVGAAVERANLANGWKALPELNKAIASARSAAAIKALNDLSTLTTTRPHLATSNRAECVQLSLLAQAERWDDVGKLGEAILARPHPGRQRLEALRKVLTSRGVNPGRRHLMLAVKSAEASLVLEPESHIPTLLSACETFYAAGRNDDAKRIAERALKLTNNSPTVAEQITGFAKP